MYGRLKILLISLLLIVLCIPANSQEVGDTLVVYFKVGSSKLELDYRDNGVRSDAFISKLKFYRSFSGITVTGIEFMGTASPEGSREGNVRLAAARQKAFLGYVRRFVDMPDSLVRGAAIHEDWENLAKFVRNDTVLTNKAQILDIIANTEVDRLAELKSLEDGSVYRYILDNIFPDIRACRVILVGDISQLVDLPVIEDEDIYPEDLFTDLVIDKDLGIVIQDPVKYKDEHILLKTNTFGWAIGMPNLAAEFDLIPHLAIAVPFYYSGGYDYFKETIKFRGIVLQPELRYYPWLKENSNAGFFVGLHLGLGWFNYALNGDYRIQDHKGNRPAYGGGVGLGYKLNFKKKPRWGMDFSIGAGVYDVMYDLFYNENNGPYYQQGIRKTWVGIDNAAVSIFYQFDLKKKGGNK